MHHVLLGDAGSVWSPAACVATLGFSFAKRSVPALPFAAGQDWVDGGIKAGKAAAYTAKRYHQRGDGWLSSWTFAGAARDLQVLGHRAGKLAAMV